MKYIHISILERNGKTHVYKKTNAKKQQVSINYSRIWNSIIPTFILFLSTVLVSEGLQIRETDIVAIAHKMWH